jgi:hypothetical protein
LGKDVVRNRNTWLILIVLVAVAVGCFAIAPAVGGVGKLLTKKKATRLFYPRGEADAKFATAGSSYSKSESDARYPDASGDIRVAVDPNHWNPQVGSGLGITRASGNVTFTDAGAGSNLPVNETLEVPQQLYGAQLRVVGFELCYVTETNSTLTSISLRSATGTPANPLGTPTDLIQDATDRTDDNCRTYNASSPVPIAPDASLHLLALLDFSAAGALRFGRTTLILRR